MGGFNTITAVVKPSREILVEAGFTVISHDFFGQFSPLPPPSLAFRTREKFLDGHVRGYLYGGKSRVALRYQGNYGDTYLSVVDTGRSGSDHEIKKYVGGELTVLASEAINLAGWYGYVFSITGSTLKSSRDNGVTFPISATDTSIATEGYGGWGGWDDTSTSFGIPLGYGAPLSPAPKPIAYFETEIIGSGTSEDPYRAQLPEDIRNGVNVLALSNSALIKTGPDGKPVEYRAIVRIFAQPDRPANLAPIGQALEALMSMSGVRRLTREEAIKEAKRLDDKLHDLDLLSARELGKDRKQAGKDYVSWRIHNLGVKEELLDISTQERYAEEDKGW